MLNILLAVSLWLHPSATIRRNHNGSISQPPNETPSSTSCKIVLRYYYHQLAVGSRWTVPSPPFDAAITTMPLLAVSTETTVTSFSACIAYAPPTVEWRVVTLAASTKKPRTSIDQPLVQRINPALSAITYRVIMGRGGNGLHSGGGHQFAGCKNPVTQGKRSNESRVCVCVFVTQPVSPQWHTLHATWRFITVWFVKNVTVEGY